MPNHWVHCLFTGSVIGSKFESLHCWVHQVLDSPSRILSGQHRILMHDLETAKKLGTVCWWAGFVAAQHIDIDNITSRADKESKQIKNLLNKVVNPIRKSASPHKIPKEIEEDFTIDKLKPEVDFLLSTQLRNMFLKIHEMLGIEITIDDKTSQGVLIVIKPNTLLKTTLDYVNQFPPKGVYIDGLTYNEAPPDYPRIIPHPNNLKKTRPHAKECMDLDGLKNIFSNLE